MKIINGLKMTFVAMFMSLLYTAVSVFATGGTGLVGSQGGISITNPFGFLSNLFTQDTLLVIFAAVSVAAFLVAALEWFGVLKSVHYWRNMLSFSFVGFFLMIVGGGPAIMAGFGMTFFYIIGALFIVGIFGAFLVKHFKQQRAWRTDKMQTDMQQDSYKATKGVVMGMSDELEPVRAKLKEKRDVFQTNMIALTKDKNPDTQAKTKEVLAKLNVQIKDLEAQELKILNVQEALKEKLVKDTEDDIGELVK